ncbi:hypothetical protein GLOIN_2v1798326 [Rhizophagus irregularis DAOM 181602=DAOM 197198]|nr:hypothetical protein GLOIN_2v1798326 [Rhizophagus irregularis DAOM 181602=DAOM 197198]
MSQNSQPKKIMIQNRKNKNTEKGLASDNRNKTITNINKSSSNIQQAVEGTATPIHERAQTTNINKSSHERAQSVKERYKNLRLPDSSNTQPPSAAPSHERVQSVKERYKNLRLPVRYQTNEPTRDDDDASTENQRLSQEVSDLRAKCLQLERRNNELTKHTAVVATEIARLREDNEFLAGVNAEFGSENNDLKEEVNELKTKLEQYQIRSSSESLDFIDVPEERLAKRFKSDGSKKVKKTKKLRRIKAAKDLYRKSDERIIGYEKRQLLKMLANRSYYSPEISESDEENPDKTILKNLLRNVIDSHSADIQTAKLQRPRQYDDEVQHFDRMHPEDAPQWSYVEQEDFIYDTEIDSRSGFDEDEDYGEETEEVLIDSQKSGAGDDLAE